MYHFWSENTFCLLPCTKISNNEICAVFWRENIIYFAPASTKISNSKICAVFGANVPFILRQIVLNFPIMKILPFLKQEFHLFCTNLYKSNEIFPLKILRINSFHFFQNQLTNINFISGRYLQSRVFNRRTRPLHD